MGRNAEAVKALKPCLKLPLPAEERAVVRLYLTRALSEGGEEETLPQLRLLRRQLRQPSEQAERLSEEWQSLRQRLECWIGEVTSSAVPVGQFLVVTLYVQVECAPGIPPGKVAVQALAEGVPLPEPERSTWKQWAELTWRGVVLAPTAASEAVRVTIHLEGQPPIVQTIPITPLEPLLSGGLRFPRPFRDVLPTPEREAEIMLSRP
jgi:hypothetical protein